MILISPSVPVSTHAYPGVPSIHIGVAHALNVALTSHELPYIRSRDLCAAGAKSKKITEMDANGYGMAENDDWNDAPGADDRPLF